MLELWCWGPENRGLRYEKEEPGKNSTTCIATKLTFEQDKDSEDVRRENRFRSETGELREIRQNSLDFMMKQDYVLGLQST